MSASPATISYVIRALLDVLIDLLENIDLSQFGVGEQGLFDPVIRALGDLEETLEETLILWREQIEASTNTDYRIADNTLHSLNTAIETNLFEIAILRNHITLRERPLPNQAIDDLTNVLANTEYLNVYESASREGDVSVVDDGYAYTINDSWNPSRGSAYARANTRYTHEGLLMDESGGGGSNATTGTAPGVYLSWNHCNRDITHNVAMFEAARSENNAIGMATAYLALNLQIRALLNSYGIWAKAPGCRIVGNHVLVSEDIDADTRARGGIRLQGDKNTNDMVALALALAASDGDSNGFDPPLNLTETLIDNNEIIGGIGHGVDIMGVAGGRGTTSFQVLFDLKVRGNQIRSMGGAGLCIDPETLAVNVEIENNLITECSNDADTAHFTLYKGGIYIENAALCRIRGNQISRIGVLSPEESNDGITGIALTRIIGLTLSDNRVLYTGSFLDGSVALRSVYGAVDVCDNEFLENRGLALAISNPRLPVDAAGNVLDLASADPILNTLRLLSQLYLGASFEANDARLIETQVLVANNVFRTPRAEWLPFESFIIGLPEGRLLLNGNSCHLSYQAASGLGNIQDARHAVVTNNLFDAPPADNPPLLINAAAMTSLIVTSNLSTTGSGIVIDNSVGTTLRKANNIPTI